MYTTKTRDEYIHDFAKAARPIFVKNNWTWFNEFVKGCPSILDIENMVKYLVKSLDDEPNSIRCCGRIVVIKTVENPGFELSLSLTTTYHL